MPIRDLLKEQKRERKNKYHIPGKNKRQRGKMNIIRRLGRHKQLISMDILFETILTFYSEKVNTY